MSDHHELPDPWDIIAHVTGFADTAEVSEALYDAGWIVESGLKVALMEAVVEAEVRRSRAMATVAAGSYRGSTLKESLELHAAACGEVHDARRDLDTARDRWTHHLVADRFIETAGGSDE